MPRVHNQVELATFLVPRGQSFFSTQTTKDLFWELRANCYEKLEEEMEQAGATAQDSAQKLAEIQKLFFKDLATTYKYHKSSSKMAMAFAVAG